MTAAVITKHRIRMPSVASPVFGSVTQGPLRQEL